MGGLLSSKVEDDWKSDAQHAMETGSFCVVCGNPFDIEGDVYNIDPKDTRFQWLYSLRLLGGTSDVAEHMVASEGSIPINMSELPDIYLSEVASFSSTGSGYFRIVGDAGQDDIWFDALAYTCNHGTLFPLHEQCIVTSCRAIDHHYSARREVESKPTLKILYQLLSARFNQRKCCTDKPYETSNDIFDLCSSPSEYGPRSVLALSRLEWWGGKYDKFYTDPVEEEGTISFVRRVLQSLPCRRDEPKYKLKATREPQRLERLPTELLDAVCSYLPAPSVIALHRTSKALALRIPLDYVFWRNSLRDGSLHPHIWDLDTKQIEHHLSDPDAAVLGRTVSWDWKVASKLLATKRLLISGCDDRLLDVPDGFWNRCRIWATIAEALQEQDTLW
ncbi:hypothetical protein G6011_04761 [Alternaria panax]|uniref:F-box domain-containing protein n=1 Tax=Alternaria panax TaxID=48097 RepID=A0AAD4IH43_9PLEO|nr:hypothetical protein G6011_04761 [Alternaria panax]